MSGGVAYIYGRHNELFVNKELVDIKELDKSDESELLGLISEHLKQTGSQKAARILKRFSPKNFFTIMPRDYAKMLDLVARFKKSENPELKAFLALES